MTPSTTPVYWFACIICKTTCSSTDPDSDMCPLCEADEDYLANSHGASG